jgi:hypothetical protein
MYKQEKTPHLVVPEHGTIKHGILIVGCVMDGDRVVAETRGWFSRERTERRTKALAESMAYWVYPNTDATPWGRILP